MLKREFMLKCENMMIEPFYAHLLWSRGYTKVLLICGEVGASELAMHMGIVQRRGVAAFVRPGIGRYAYVLLDDGEIVEGCFTRFGDGTFSLS